MGPRWLRVTRVLHRAPLMVLLALPLGYGPTGEDASLHVRLGGGAAQTYGITTDCQGDEIERTFGPTGQGVASLEYRIRPESGPHTGFGLRTTWWFQRDADRRDSPAFASDGWTWNPYVDLDFEEVGVGLGVVFGDVPLDYEDLFVDEDGIPDDLDPSFLVSPFDDIPDVFLSGHLRMGPSDRRYFYLGLMELQPYMVAGLFQAGLAYDLGSLRGMTGVSSGWYVDAGVIQVVEWDVTERLSVDLIGRYGTTGGRVEGGLAAGISGRFGHRDANPGRD